MQGAPNDARELAPASTASVLVVYLQGGRRSERAPLITAGDEHRFTFKCEGGDRTVVSLNLEKSAWHTHVTRCFTLYVRGSTGRWYDWELGNWHAINSVDANGYGLLNSALRPDDINDGPDLYINRLTGAWTYTVLGMQSLRDSTAGKCEGGRAQNPAATKI